MAIVTKPRSDMWVYHDADPDRQALHDRFAAWEQTSEGRTARISADVMNVDSFTFEQEGQPTIYTIVVTFARKSEAQQCAEDRASQLQRQVEIVFRRLKSIEQAVSSAVIAAEPLSDTKQEE